MHQNARVLIQTLSLVAVVDKTNYQPVSFVAVTPDVCVTVDVSVAVSITSARVSPTKTY